MVAPAVEGQFGDTITMSSIRTACKKLGFNDMDEVGLGGDLTAQAEAEADDQERDRAGGADRGERTGAEHTACLLYTSRCV